MPFYFPKKHRYHKLTLYFMLAELPVTVVILTLTGIASHNLYRSLLWQDGADNGFNSAPNEALYAAANYRPYTAPMVWSSFLTNYNLVIGVLSTFMLIVKFPVHLMRLFYPPLAAFIHCSLIILYVVSARFQAGSDMSDPKHPQPGPPWYITKSCSVAAHKSDIGYCEQAKSLFGVTFVIITLYLVELGFNIHSCFVTKDERTRIDEKREEKKIEKEFEEAILNSPGFVPMNQQMIPRTPGMVPGQHYPPTPGYPFSPGFSSCSPGIPPMAAGGAISPYTPRTLAFNRLGGGSTSSDLPLRQHAQSSPNGQQSSSEAATPQTSQESQMYFPPPPKQAVTRR
ncbi:uncharacterized protein PFLUO_LOCUS8875 [Penicillium psychrofluorescens]|uniref:uncharacterized protein n=1 Tax=Penicillium psychrofluorescens TaxID=3158075 RepID=UPI003CCCDB96